MSVTLRSSMFAAAFVALLTILCSPLPGCGGDDDGDGDSETPGGQANLPPTSSGDDESLNWSGYAVAGAPATFNKVQGSWTVPSVDCTADETSASAAWTGIGGFEPFDPTLIQAGTAQECNDGPVYYAWWEAIPGPAVEAGELLDAGTFPVQPGDQITVTVDGTSGLVWQITIRNDGAGWTFEISVPYGAAGTSAEWIMEAPLSVGTSGAGQDTLSNFGSVAFSSLTANDENPNLTENDRIVMVDFDGTVIANPSGVGGGDSFTVCFGSGACP